MTTVGTEVIARKDPSTKESVEMDVTVTDHPATKIAFDKGHLTVSSASASYVLKGEDRFAIYNINDEPRLGKCDCVLSSGLL
jgi:hypothetical protein